MQGDWNLPELPSDFKVPDFELPKWTPYPFYIIRDGEVYYNTDAFSPDGYFERVDVGPVQYV